MRIIFCVKQVPDTTEVEIDPVTKTLIRTGVPAIINPDDKTGIELALNMRDSIGGGSTVTAVSMGPMQAKMALREALAMGCDDAVLISGRQFGGSDTLATSTILAAAIKKIGFDLIIAGRQAIDGDTAQVGPGIAEHLGVPQVTYVEDVHYADGAFIAKRQFEDRYHLVKVKPPCLLTAITDHVEPRYMTVRGVVAAGDAPIAILDYEALADTLDASRIGLKGSPTNVVTSYTKEQKSQGAVLKGLSADEAVDAIMARLHEGHIL